MTFQVIVHAPELRPGARLCVSDLAQKACGRPDRLHEGASLSLRFGACCPRLGEGRIASIRADVAMLQHGGAEWRMRRCERGGGVFLPGLVAEDWFIIARRE